MSLFAGAVIYGNPGASRRLTDILVRLVAQTGSLKGELLYDDDWLTLYRISRNVPAICAADMAADGVPAWLIGDLSYASPESVAQALTHPPVNQANMAEVPGRWHYIEVDKQARGLRITSDVLGLQHLYIGRRSDGFVFANDFAAVVSCLDTHPSLDVDTCLLELAMGSAPDCRTVFENVTMAPAGACIEITERGIRNVWKMAIEYGDDLNGKNDQEKFERLEELYRYTIDRHVRPFSESLYISLSAGLDSRYALAWTRECGLDVGLATFGHPRSTELIECRRVCGRIGRSTEEFPALEKDWAQWRDRVRILGNTRVMQWSGWEFSWCDFLQRRARSVIHGLMGDAASGKRLEYFSPEAERWLPAWLAAWSVWDVMRPNTAPRVVRRDAAERLAESVEQRYQDALADINFAHRFQQAHHLNWYGRQRRDSAGQVNIMQRYVTPVLFHVNARLLDFWRNVPHKDLDHQRLYLAYARSRFPKLFPREETFNRTRTLRFRVAEKLRRTYMTMRGMDTLGNRPPVLNRDLTLVANKHEIRRLIERVGPMASTVLDIDQMMEALAVHGQSGGLRNAHIMPAINLLLLLEPAVEKH